MTGAQDEIVINAAWGLGEAVVGGRVNPDILRVMKATGRIIEIKIGDKAVRTALMEQGTGEVVVEDERRQQKVLSPGQVAELARFGCEVEAQFGGPQDIEWAISRGGAPGENIFLLQSRPETAWAAMTSVKLALRRVPSTES